MFENFVFSRFWIILELGEIRLGLIFLLFRVGFVSEYFGKCSLRISIRFFFVEIFVSVFIGFLLWFGEVVVGFLGFVVRGFLLRDFGKMEKWV